ncbi:MAG: hypothetical protein ACRD1V_00920 [Vicinamibacterales bacterium]
MLLGSVAVLAHPMTFKGTVATVERTRMQVKTGEEKKGEAPPWLLISETTKVLRGSTTVTFDQAKITVGEKVVVNVDHDADGVMRAVEIHLAAR